MTEETDMDWALVPTWARERIADLTRERDNWHGLAEEVVALLHRAESAERERDEAHERCQNWAGKAVTQRHRVEAAEHRIADLVSQLADEKRKHQDVLIHIDHFQEIVEGDRDQHLTLVPVTKREAALARRAEELERALAEANNVIRIYSNSMPSAQPLTQEPQKP